MSDVLISYARADSEVAHRITKALEQQGFSVFQDATSLVAGVDFQHEITRALKSSSAVIAILSANSKRSKWVEHELQMALEEEKIVIPVLLDEEGKDNWVWPLMSDRLAFRLTKDFSTDELVRSLSSSLGPRRRRQSRLVAIIALISAVLGAVGAVMLTKWLN